MEPDWSFDAELFGCLFWESFAHDAELFMSLHHSAPLPRRRPPCDHPHRLWLPQRAADGTVPEGVFGADGGRSPAERGGGRSSEIHEASGKGPPKGCLIIAP